MTNNINISDSIDTNQENQIQDWFYSVLGPLILTIIFTSATWFFYQEITRHISSKEMFESLDMIITTVFGGGLALFASIALKSLYQLAARTYRHIKWSQQTF